MQKMTPFDRLRGVLGGDLERCQGELAEALARSQAAEYAFRAMVDSLPVGIATINRDGRVELWNQAAEAILGYGAAEMVGKPPPAHVFTPFPGQGGAGADVFLRMVTGQSVRGEDVQCRRRDGTLVETSFSGAPLLGDDERLRGAICVFEDIGQRKAIATQLHQAQKMEAVGQLTGGLAHDFNNLLGVAIGNLDLLEDELGDNPDAVEMLETARAALLRGADLTRALLAFSRRQPLQPERIDAGRLLSNSARMLARTLGEHISVNLRLDGELAAVVVDAAQLESSITNLAINARDAMAQGGRLTIGARNAELDEDYAAANADVVPGPYLQIEVSDTGQGMAPDVLARAFEPFFTTKPVGKGTGLGLSMVFGFIKQSGGHLRIYSEPGLGTTIRLYLPCAADAIAPAAVQPAEPVAGGSEAVLVVEDNAEVSRMVQSQLTRLGYKVLSAESGPAALAVLQAEPAIRLLFTDVVMPGGMTGFALAERAVAAHPDLRVLITSGFPGDLRGSDAGEPRWAFLGKPYRKQDLARAVRAALDGPKGALA
jgi:PAS domain S-box-containing protein